MFASRKARGMASSRAPDEKYGTKDSELFGSKNKFG
jgi:hypothetical protein